MATNKTIDCRVKFADHAGTETIWCYWVDGSNYASFEHVHGTGLQMRVVIGGSPVVSYVGGEVTDTNWHHVAMILVGILWGNYLDGTQTAYASDASTFSLTGGFVRWGALGDGTQLFSGYIDEKRDQLDNWFEASPNATPNDTIEVPTAPYNTSTGTIIPIIQYYNNQMRA